MPNDKHTPAYNVHAVASVLPEAPATLVPSLPRPVRRKELKFLLLALHSSPRPVRREEYNFLLFIRVYFRSSEIVVNVDFIF